MKKICLIQQDAGLGDIIFCQGVADHYSALGYRVVWPVVKELIENVDCIDSKAEFFNREDSYPLKDMSLEDTEKRNFTSNINGDIRVPLGWSCQVPPYPHPVETMRVKYKMCGLDYNLWKDKFSMKRNIAKENELFYDVLNLKDSTEYTLLNQTYATQPTTIFKDITRYLNTCGELQVCEMKIINGFTLFDWCKVFEKMINIVTVDTSLMYVLEKLSLNNTINFIVVPRSHITPSVIGNLFNINWRYIYE